jgi:hypothetical protein
LACDHAAPRRPVNLNADLVERCESKLGSRSAHGETRRATGSEKRAAAEEAVRRRTLRVIDAFAALYNAHGSRSEEMQSL